jgi:hypothetical protein
VERSPSFPSGQWKVAHVRLGFAVTTPSADRAFAEEERTGATHPVLHQYCGIVRLSFSPAVANAPPNPQSVWLPHIHQPATERLGYQPLERGSINAPRARIGLAQM